MPRVTWDTPGTRLFHTGIDRGMLYIGNNVAVPWSGLTGVTESPTGGSATDYYVDGRKVLSVANSEEFGATIDAFSAPIEFAPCAGRLRLSPGLFATDQPKKFFSFSYRTLIGNDVSGTGFAYKVHLVYNALAKVSNFTYGTVSNSPSAKSYSWAITTIPEVVTGYRPTSHFVVDSRNLDPVILAQLEAILYGDDSNDPRFPSAQEFVNLTSS